LKRTYRIDKQRALQQFRKAATTSNENIQLVFPLAEVLALVQQGLMKLALEAFTMLGEEMMKCETAFLVGPKNQADASRTMMRWGSQTGYCVVGGQKVPLQRPRVRNVRKREVPLGSYELLQQASLMEESVWHKIMHGLTTRRYSEVVRELEQAYGIEKSTVSEHFIEVSRQRLEKLLGRPLGEHALCAMMVDGTCFEDQQVVVAIGLTLQGHKVILGLHQGATENATVETVCRNVKRWQGGDQYLRWVASGLLWAESRWNRIHGYRELPILVKELELAVVKEIPLRHAVLA
jgi:putative transposase